MERNEDKITMNVSEAAAALGISRPTFYEIMRRDDFDCVLKIGRRKLISRSKLEEWVRRQAELKC